MVSKEDVSKEQLQREVELLKEEIDQLKKDTDTCPDRGHLSNMYPEKKDERVNRRRFLKKAGILGAVGLGSTLFGKQASAFDLRSNEAFTVSTLTGSTNFNIDVDGDVDIPNGTLTEQGNRVVVTDNADGYEIQKNGEDGDGIINFKTQ